jgi:hypothetical protein
VIECYTRGGFPPKSHGRAAPVRAAGFNVYLRATPRRFTGLQLLVDKGYFGGLRFFSEAM